MNSRPACTLPTKIMSPQISNKCTFSRDDIAASPATRVEWPLGASSPVTKRFCAALDIFNLAAR